MKKNLWVHLMCSLVLAACSAVETATTSPATCTATANTTATTTTSALGCAQLTRDTSACESSRTAQGLSGFWLKFSCSVTLTKSGSNVLIATAGTPDYKSYYWGSTNACYEAFSIDGRSPNPNTFASQSFTVGVPFAPASKSGQKTDTDMGVVGVSVNGVVIFNNQANGDDNIYDEVATFDACEGHPAGTTYHYHIEPPAISNNDSYLIGVMRDGFPVYGVKDADGSTPTLDQYGGHSGPLPNDPTTTLYHYHLVFTNGTDGDGQPASAYFLMGDKYYGTPGTTCENCSGQGGGPGA